MKVSLIVAIGGNSEIGKDNDLLWHLPKDMRFFTQTTKGHYVIMGRKNWDSIPLKYRPLSGRENVVVSRKLNLELEGAIVVSTIEEGIELARVKGETEVFIIGGGQIYREALRLDLIDTMFITKVHSNFDADTFFPDFEMDNWTEESIGHFEADEKNSFPFSISKFSRKIN
jgi:dihydrofolate reductase